MTLTVADVERLEAAGFRDFLRHGPNGQLHIRRAGDRCLFLHRGRCVVYRHRPEGCLLYPLVLDVVRDLVLLDDFCPHRGEFRFSASDRARLRHSVRVEEGEAAARTVSPRRVV